MKKVLIMVIVAAVFGGFALAEEAKDLFVSEKCVKCHSIDSQGIESTNKNPDKVTDLSDAGNKVDKDALKPYLKKEAEMNGNKHKLKFKGDEATLDTLVNWLVTLKQ